MRSNYKRLGDYIEPCNEKNIGNLIKELRGISNQKFFQKAKTNTIGIDLSKYRVVRTGQFAFNRATTRNGDKISIALREKEDCIVSPSYRMFKSKDENVLNSEYLMMWFRRPEFDRYARFKSHGSAHEFFDLNEMYEVELPIPSIEKQREIVKEYNTIVNRIKLNEKLNEKLEETAQAVYKHWFVDFEFPNENGQPYKSSGGQLVYKEELDQEIPVGWFNETLDEVMNVKHGYAFKGDHITLEENENILLSPGNFKIGGGFKDSSFKYYTGYVPEDYIFQTGDIMVTMTDLSVAGDTLGYPAIIPRNLDEKYLHNQRLGKLEFKDNTQSTLFYYWLLRTWRYRTHVLGSATGTTVRHTSPTRILDYSYPCSNNEKLFTQFQNKMATINLKQESLMFENQLLKKLSNLLHSKLSQTKDTIDKTMAI